MIRALSITLRSIRYGWSVQLSDGRELARFLGPGFPWCALHYLTRAAKSFSAPGEQPGPRLTL
ncbi:MAG: hypothetical protein ACLP01_06690 [Solirubrobacteraceae bacterium]